jgi:hypothetical protein
VWALSLLMADEGARMLNEISITHCNNLKQEALLSQEFTKPSGTYSFAAIPHTITQLFGLPAQGNRLVGALPSDCLVSTATAYDHLVVVFIDALGWQLTMRLLEANSSLLQRVREEGVLSKLTSQFPSTTAAHVTTTHTGLAVAESMIPNWFYYEPSIDAVISPLLGSFAKDGSRRETLKESGVHLSTMLPSTTLYEYLEENGVNCYSYQAEQFCFSSYTQHVTRGATLRSFSSFSEGISKLHTQLMMQAMGTRSLHAIYCDTLDGVCHKYGAESDGALKHAQSLLDQISKVFFEYGSQSSLQAGKAKTALLLMADHGHVVSPSDTAVYLDIECPEIIPMLRRSGDGRIIAPGGANRDYFLYVKPQSIDEVVQILQHKLSGRFSVLTVDALVEAGYFHTQEIPALLKQRMGDVVVLPHAGESCFWSDGGRHVLNAYSSHGGLTEAEMMIPFGMLEL